MKREKISEVVEHINTKYVEEAATYTGKKEALRTGFWYKWGALAACVALVVIGSIKLIPSLLGDNADGKYIHQIAGMESAMEWPWEYKTLGEKYQTVTYEGKKYSIKSFRQITEAFLGECLGTVDAEGVDSYTDKVYTESLEVYQISGVSEEKLIAAGTNGEFYVYRLREVEKPATFGELMQVYGLSENLEFYRYQVCEGYKGKGYYNLEDDAYIWQILSDCKDAPLDDSVDSFDRSNRNYLSFTVTSDELGVYKRVVYISEDGYFATNIFDYSHIYFIGTDAAGKIIEYAKQHSEEGAAEAYEQTVSGTLVGIGEDYVLVDDSVLCRKKEDSTVYKIYTDDIRMKRCVEVAGSKVGDIVVVKYDGEISDSNEIFGAYSMDKGTLMDGSVAVPE